MKKYILPVLLIAGSSFFSLNGMAQNQPDNSAQHETIILKKEKGIFPDDLTIHIEGDKITINGKTPDDISVTRKKNTEDRAMMFKQFHQNGSSGTFQHPFGGMNGNNSKAFLGVLTRRNDSSKGARIVEIEAGTPADSAGLKKGDVIIGVNDHQITSSVDLSNVINSYDPGEKIKITYLWDGKKYNKTITLGRLDNVHRRMFSSRPFETYLPPNGFSLDKWFRQHHPQMKRNPKIRMYHNRGPKLGVVVENHDQPEGAKIIHLSPNSHAAKAQLKEGDIITSFADENIDDIDDLKEAVSENKGKDKIKVEVERDGKRVMLSVSLEGRKERASL